ncbi:choice-of-anchor D domain-containing protein [Pontimicrobium sp. SW4]|uniref:Choice-of-anchor D domain-containing protein n=1 Tax=Pontimicrobium sp. SW4 TaxID=3153519 RepID=A0AAU7BRH6_9FLAO
MNQKYVYNLLKILLLTTVFSINNLFAQRTPVAGSIQTYNNGISWGTNAQRLSDDKIIVYYKNASSGSTGDGFAVVGTISGSTISWGSALELVTDNIIYAKIVTLSSEKVLFVYEENATPDVYKYKMLTISGTTITASSSAQLSNTAYDIGWQRSLQMVALTENQVVIAMEANIATDSLKVFTGTVSGNTISWGNEVNVASNVSNVSLVRMSDMKFAMGYEWNDGAISGEGMLVAGTVNSNAITMGTPQSFESTSIIGTIGLTSLTESSLAVIFEDDGGTDEGRLFYATLSGTTFTIPGSETNFYSGKSIEDLSMTTLSSTEVVVGINGQSTTTSHYFTASLLGNNFTLGAETELISGNADEFQVVSINADKFVGVFIDDDNVNGVTDERGDVKVFTLTSTTNPEINIQGNSTDIVSGDSSPSTSDYTDFGTGASLSKTFTIQNTGSGTLTLGSNAVSISGTNASDFSVSTQPATSVSGSSSTTFTIDFASGVASTRTAVLHINNDDIHEYNYHFSIQAVGASASVPIVTTTTASNISTTSATIGGNVTSDGGDTVSERGVVYAITSTNNNPTIGGIGVTKDDNASGIGAFSESITGLAASTQYSYAAYAINNQGTSYGTVKMLITSALSVDDEFLQKSINVYPNPVVDELYIDIESSIEVEDVKVYDVSGKLLRTLTLINKKINFSNVYSGLYFIKVRTNQGSLTKIIVKK